MAEYIPAGFLPTTAMRMVPTRKPRSTTATETRPSEEVKASRMRSWSGAERLARMSASLGHAGHHGADAPFVRLRGVEYADHFALGDRGDAIAQIQDFIQF